VGLAFLFFATLRWLRTRVLGFEILFQTLKAIIYSLIAAFFISFFFWISRLSESSNVEIKVIAASIVIGVMITWKNTSGNWKKQESL
jgi:hypothetical protein